MTKTGNKNNTCLRSSIKKYTGWYLIFLMVWVLSFYIFRRKSLFTDSDGIYEQYVYFLYVGKWIRCLLNNIFVTHTFELPMWDMSIGMGGDSFVTLSGVANLFADPFCWIATIVPLSISEYVFDICVLMKLYLAGAAFVVCSEHFGYKGRSAIAGALVYTFSATTFIGFGQPNFQWLFILFPLLIVEVDRMWKRTGHRRYVLLLAYCVLYSYYYTYMMGLLIIIYCVSRFFLEKKTVRELPGMLLRFAYCTAIGLGIGVGPLLPAIVSMSKMDRLRNEFEMSIFAFDRLSDALFNSFSGTGLFHDSFWGCSSIFLICLILLYTKKHENTLLKIFIILFPVSLAVPFIGSLFNGFSFSTDRYVFGLIFLAAYIVAVKFDELPLFRGKIWRYTLVLSAVYLIFTVIISVFFGNYSPVASGISLFVVVAVIGWYNNKGLCKSEKTNLFYMAIIFLSIAPVSLFGLVHLYEAALDFGSANKVLFESTGIDLIEDHESTKDHRFDYVPYTYDMEPLNSSMILGVNGYDFYHSNYNNDLDNYYDSLAVISNTIGYSYSGMRGRDYLELINGSEYLLCYEAKDTALNIPYSYEHVVSGEEYGLYTASTDTSLVYFYDDCISSDYYAELSPICREELMMTTMVADTECDLSEAYNPNHADIEFTVSDTQNIEFTGEDTFTVTDKGYMLLEFDPVTDSEISIYLDGLNSNVGYAVVPSLVYDNEILSADFLGGIDVGNFYYHGKDTFLFNFGFSRETVNGIKIIFTIPGDYSLNDIKIYTRDSEQLNNTIEAFYEHADIDDVSYEINGNNISINAYADEQKYLYIAVPYSEGWKAYLDGEEVDIIKANIAFMAIPISEGEHTVELKYITPYLKEGMTCSLISLIGLGICEFLNKKKKEA